MLTARLADPRPEVVAATDIRQAAHEERLW
jgi:hypothetical protein